MKGGILALVALASLGIVHELLARALDAHDLIERLLSPGNGALVAIPTALVLYALRLFLVFAGPGIALAAMIRIMSRWRAPAITRIRP